MNLPLTPWWPKLLAAFGITYFFFTLFRLPVTAATGLDPSWTLVLSEAAIHGGVHGRDIIFTYGPLGFLTSGRGIPELYVFLTAVHALIAVAYLIVAAYRSREIRSLGARIAFFLFATLYAVYAELDYILLFMFFLIVTRPETRLQPRVRDALFYGAAAAGGMLVKPTLGFDVLGFVLIYYVVEAALSRSATWLQCVAAIVASFLATFIVCFELIRISPVAAIVAGLFAALMLYLLRRSILDRTPRMPPRLLRRALLLIALLSAVSIGLDAAARDYFRAAVEFSIGYSSALVFPGSDLVRAFAILEAVIVAIVLVNARSTIGYGLSFASLYTTWAAFKHGFVRQDGHILYFFVTIAALTFAIVLSTANSATRRRLGILAGSTAVGLLLIDSYHLHFNAFRGLFPAAVIANVQIVLKLPEIASSVASDQEAALAPDVLSPQVRATIGAQPVDIEPWEAAAATANRLNWHPLPIFQSYAAYTRWLENRNASHLVSDGPRVVLLSLLDIDGRSQITDEPTVWRELMCRYRPASSAPIILNGVPAVALVRSPSVCRAARPVVLRRARWRESIAVPHERHAWTALEIGVHYSPLGAAKKLAYRASPLTLTLVYADGTTFDIRLVPEVLGPNQPVFISPFPRAVADFTDLLNSPPRVVNSITFHTDDESSFDPIVTAGFEIVPVRS